MVHDLTFPGEIRYLYLDEIPNNKEILMNELNWLILWFKRHCNGELGTFLWHKNWHFG